MSGSGRQEGNKSSTLLKTGVTLLVGAAAGAIAAFSYFAATSEEPQAHQNQRPPQRNSTSNDDELKDEKAIQVCEICFMDFDEIKLKGEQILATKCGHVFCRECILQSLQRKPDCPHCRQPVTANQLQRLYL